MRLKSYDFSYGGVECVTMARSSLNPTRHLGWLTASGMAVGLALWVPNATAAAEAAKADGGKPAAAYDPTERYERIEIEGWPVRIHTDFARQPEQKTATLKLLGQQLFQITRVVPPAAPPV